MEAKLGLITLFILSLAACSSSPVAVEQTRVLTETSSFEEQAANPSKTTPFITRTPEPATPTSELPLPDSSTATARAPAADQDLTHLLMEHNLYPQYGKPGIQLVGEHQLLVWFDSAALFDLSSEALLYKTDVTDAPFDQKVEFVKNGVGLLKKEPVCTEGALDTVLEEVFPNDINCMDHPVILERYDSKLNLIETLDLSRIFDMRFDVLRPAKCALSQNGEKLACAKNETGQILLYDLQTKDQKLAFDISWANIASFRGINSITFAGNDRYLAFTTLDESGYGYGLIDLEHSRLLAYAKWNAVAEDIQTTEKAVYFHEQLNSPQYPLSGIMIKIDLDTMNTEEIQFADKEESKYVNVSQTGKYIATVRDTAAPGAPFPKGLIKIYDGQTMALIRQIDLERGFPNVVIDEANRFLFAYFSIDRDIKMVRFGF